MKNLEPTQNIDELNRRMQSGGLTQDEQFVLGQLYLLRGLVYDASRAAEMLSAGLVAAA